MSLHLLQMLDYVTTVLELHNRGGDVMFNGREIVSIGRNSFYSVALVIRFREFQVMLH